MMTTPAPTDAELALLERQVAHALATRSTDELNVVGFGEISVALGWPAEAPSWVCKRTPPASRTDFDRYRQLVASYVDQLRAAGLGVVDTEARPVERTGDVVGYLVQPMLDPTSIGGAVLSASTPDPDHPFLCAVVDTIDLVTDRLSVDAQVTNFSWHEDQLTLLDVGTPFIWDAAGRLELDIDPFLAVAPKPLRALLRRELRSVTDRWKQPRDVAIDIVANLLREGLDDWVPAAIETVNRRFRTTPITADDARASLAEDTKIFPVITRLQKVERAWQTRVRRRPYDFFINSTFNGSSIS